MKIYCENCLYIGEIRMTGSTESNAQSWIEDYICRADDNINPLIFDTWFKHEVITNHMGTKKPEEINKNNDCKWFHNKDVI